MTKILVYIGPGHYYLPDLYIRKNHFQVLFTTVPVLNLRMEISYDNGNTWNVLKDRVNYDSGWLTLPFHENGEYKIYIKYIDLAGHVITLPFNIFVVDDITDRYYDDNNNVLFLWGDGASHLDKLILMVEGFDPSNSNRPEMYYKIGNELISKVKSFGYDIAILNFADGGADMRKNSEVLLSLLNFLFNKNGNKEIIVVGIRMGGVIARYALAKAEQNGYNLNVPFFISMDAPQQYAIIDKNLLNFIKKYDESLESPLNSMAAKQLLIYNPYDSKTLTTQSEHEKFYKELNSISGNGYPKKSKNIGVAFSSNKSNPNSGIWLKVKVDLWMLPDFLAEEESFSLYNDILVPGSLLPRDVTYQAGFIIEHGGVVKGDYDFVRFSDPTFIPYRSALDIKNGKSMFNKIIYPRETYFHDSLPHEVIAPLLAEIGININLKLNITGPIYLGYNENGTFTANPSGGNGTYVDYRWWYRNDDGVFNVNKKAGDVNIMAPIAGEWIEMSYNRGKRIITAGFTFNFSLKCEVTDSKGNKAYDTHSVIVRSGGVQWSVESRHAEKEFSSVPEQFVLKNNYPNPFNPITTIRFGLPERSHVKLTIYSIMGQKVKTLVNEDLSEGYYRIQWDGKNQSGSRLSSGVYIYELVTDHQRLVKKMVLTK